jgi:hypothetical protein
MFTGQRPVKWHATMACYYQRYEIVVDTLSRPSVPVEIEGN